MAAPLIPGPPEPDQLPVEAAPVGIRELIPVLDREPSVEVLVQPRRFDADGRPDLLHSEEAAFLLAVRTEDPVGREIAGRVQDTVSVRSLHGLVRKCPKE